MTDSAVGSAVGTGGVGSGAEGSDMQAPNARNDSEPPGPPIQRLHCAMKLSKRGVCARLRPFGETTTRGDG